MTKGESLVDKLSIICLTIVVIGSIISIAIYQINDRVLMSKNIQDAIAKGVDPLTVRCSYAKGDDIICVAFATKSDQSLIQSIPTKK
jgi:hypothetical protein